MSPVPGKELLGLSERPEVTTRFYSVAGRAGGRGRTAEGAASLRPSLGLRLGRALGASCVSSPGSAGAWVRGLGCDRCPRSEFSQGPV